MDHFEAALSQTCHETFSRCHSRHAHAHARLVGELHELHELLAFGLEAPDYALAVAELGMEVDPPAPYAPGAWLALVADRIGGFRAEYGPPDADG